MTPKWVEDQIAVLNAAGAKALVSKETALEFLRSAGIPDTPAIDCPEPQMTGYDNFEYE